MVELHAELISASGIATSAGALVVGLFDGPAAGRGAEAVRAQLGIDVLRLAASDPDFTGAEGQLLTVVASWMPRAPSAFGGLGAREAVSDLLSAGPRMRASSTTAHQSLLALESSSTRAVAAVVEGHRLGGWRYGASAADGPLAVVGRRADASRAASARGSHDQLGARVGRDAAEPARPERFRRTDREFASREAPV